MLVRLAIRAPTQGGLASPSDRKTIGLDPELAALLARPGEASG
jgi:hypothetical protein